MPPVPPRRTNSPTIGTLLRSLIAFLLPHRWKSDLAEIKRLLASDHPAPEGLGVRIDRWLGSVGWEVRNAALKLIAHIRDEARYPLLAERLCERAEAGIVRRNAAEMLAKVAWRTPEARRALVAALGDSYWEVRAEAGRALAALFEPAADLEAALLGRLFAARANGRRRLREGNFEVRMAIAEGLGTLGVGRPALDALTELAGDTSWLVRSQSAVGLAHFASRREEFRADAREVVRHLDRQSEGSVSYFVHRDVLGRALKLIHRGHEQEAAGTVAELRSLYLNPKRGWNHVLR